MNRLVFRDGEPRGRFGVKGPRAADWLTEHGIALPLAPNTWTTSSIEDDALLVARLGSSEFFLEDGAGRRGLRDITPAVEPHPPGVYPVLREDAAFLLSGDGAYDVLAQVCNVNFRELALPSRPVVMTLMIGVAVLVVPQGAGAWPGDAAGARAEPSYRIWCDPTFGPYLDDALGKIVSECGGHHGRGSA